MLEEILARRQATFLAAYFDPAVRDTPVPTPQEHEYIYGIHREPVAGAIKQPGNRFVPPAHIFAKGRRVSTGRSQRFAAS